MYDIYSLHVNIFTYIYVHEREGDIHISYFDNILTYDRKSKETFFEKFKIFLFQDFVFHFCNSNIGRSTQFTKNRHRLKIEGGMKTKYLHLKRLNLGTSELNQT